MNKWCWIAWVLCLAFFSNAYAEPQLLAKGANDFGVDLYRKLSAASGDKNLFLSPYSIYGALGMVYAGSAGETAGEFENTLGIPDPAAFHPALSETMASLNARDGHGFSISVANALWIDRRAPILDAYRALIKKYYGDSGNAMDATKPQESADTINGWVAEKTKNKIQGLLTPEEITPDTKLVLTNAVYFKGEWLYPFEKTGTREEDFTSFSGAPFKAPLMHQRDYFESASMDGSAFIKLPYKGSALSMVIILPEERGAAALTAAEDKLSKNLADFLSRKIAPVQIDLTLPKFKIETPVLILNDPLRALGIRKAFDSSADFSGMSDEKLRVGLVLHKAMVQVDEEGSEAAAATAVTMLAGCCAPNPNTPKEFKVDRPFLFLIRDDKTGVVLFMGKLLRP